MINPLIKVTDYNKLSDTVMQLGNNCQLKFNVLLSLGNKNNGGMQSFHSEYSFYDSRYGSDRYYIYRTFKYYLSIELSGEIRESVNIGINEMTLFKMMVNSALEWFTNSEYSDLYATKNNRLVLTKAIEPKHITVSYKGYIEMEPMVYVYPTGETDFGVRIYLNSDTIYTEIPLSTFLGLHYIINSIDMYQCAIGLLNYLQRPELGTNLYQNTNAMDMTTKNYEVVKEESQKSYNKSGRKIENRFTKNIHDL